MNTDSERTDGDIRDIRSQIDGLASEVRDLDQSIDQRLRDLRNHPAMNGLVLY